MVRCQHMAVLAPMTDRRLVLDGTIVGVEFVEAADDLDFGTVVVTVWDEAERQMGALGLPLMTWTLHVEEVPLLISLLGAALDDRSRFEHELGRTRHVRPIPDPDWVWPL